jgi:hypothetical protein
MVGSEISRFSIQELQKNVDVVFEDLEAVVLTENGYLCSWQVV